LEDLLQVRLFTRTARGTALTPQGKALYPGLKAGFDLLQDAFASLQSVGGGRILVASTPPGFTSKWLAARLYRFSEAHPDLELRVASSVAYANFTTDGVDVAIRNAPESSARDPQVVHEKLLDDALVAVCSPKLIARLGPLEAPGVLANLPLIRDDQTEGQRGSPTWTDWSQAAGLDVGDIGRGGLHFSSADHALDAALEGAGLLLTHAILAYDDLRSGRLVSPFDVAVSGGRAYYLAYPLAKQKLVGVQAFRGWVLAEFGSLDRAHLVCRSAARATG